MIVAIFANMKNDNKYISHIRRGVDGAIEAFQDNDAHCSGVAELAKRFASEFGMGDLGYIIGLYHDKGKESTQFQEYIQDVNGIPGHKRYTSTGKSHAFVGGLMIKRLFRSLSPLLCNPVMGHHRGLYDYLDLEEEERKVMPPEIGIPTEYPSNPVLPPWFAPSQIQENDFHHIERMLYSCLVDADYLDTEQFMQPVQSALRCTRTKLSSLSSKLEAYLSRFENPTSEVNKIRTEVLHTCLQAADGEPGFYSLTVPTGGGKTLSSLAWAFRHAAKHRKNRIIIAIPYTSIIVQTAAVLRGIFGEENVLEHHSHIDPDEIKDELLSNKMKLATENWDYPIVVTTNVQLFESMFSNRPSDCRKLHHICNSVLILDEVQTLPIGLLQPIIDSLNTYQRLFGLSVLFITASQPILAGNHYGCNPSVTLRGLPKMKEIISHEAKLHQRLRRVEFAIDDQPHSYDEVAAKLSQHDRVLCIVNTRRDAREIFDRLPNEGIRIHLSRMMCPAHLASEIDKMKRALTDMNQPIVRVVSTQLIEAGVDIDFPVVYRQEAGLDSLLQAAGRCNREGKSGIGITYVFSLLQEHPLPPGYISQCNDARKNMVGTCDLFSPEAMSAYFQQLYSRVDSFDKKDMAYYLYHCRELMMETASQTFRMIDDTTIPVVVPWGRGLELAERMKQEGPSYSLVKQLGQYSVSLRKHDFDQLYRDGLVEEFLDGFYLAPWQSQYCSFSGLSLKNLLLEETFII